MEGPRYEVMYLLDAPDDKIDAFKASWMEIGESIVIVGGDGLWNCHIHADDIGASIEAGIEAGRPRQIRVTDLAGQVEEERWVRQGLGAAPGAATRTRVTTAVVAVALGDDVGDGFRSFGVQEVVVGGQTMNPSTADLLEAIEATDADEVIVLPNNKNIVPVAGQAADLASKPVRVVPTRGMVAGLAAMMAYDPGAPAEANAKAMEQRHPRWCRGRSRGPCVTRVRSTRATGWAWPTRRSWSSTPTSSPAPRASSTAWSTRATSWSPSS